MALRVGLLLLVLSSAVLASSSSFNDASFATVARFDLDSMRSDHIGSCNGEIGDCIDEDEEMMLDSEAARRNLAQRRYISYGALKKNNVPCSRRGQSYYQCNQRGRANPYTRGCSVITRCHRANY